MVTMVTMLTMLTMVAMITMMTMTTMVTMATKMTMVTMKTMVTIMTMVTKITMVTMAKPISLFCWDSFLQRSAALPVEPISSCHSNQSIVLPEICILYLECCVSCLCCVSYFVFVWDTSVCVFYVWDRWPALNIEILGKTCNIQKFFSRHLLLPCVPRWKI